MGEGADHLAIVEPVELLPVELSRFQEVCSIIIAELVGRYGTVPEQIHIRLLKFDSCFVLLDYDGRLAFSLVEVHSSLLEVSADVLILGIKRYVHRRIHVWLLGIAKNLFILFKVENLRRLLALAHWPQLWLTPKDVLANRRQQFRFNVCSFTQHLACFLLPNLSAPLTSAWLLHHFILLFSSMPNRWRLTLVRKGSCYILRLYQVTLHILIQLSLR